MTNKCTKCGKPVCDCVDGESCDVCLYGSGLCLDCEVNEAYDERSHVTPKQEAWYYRHVSEFHE